MNWFIKTFVFSGLLLGSSSLYSIVDVDLGPFEFRPSVPFFERDEIERDEFVIERDRPVIERGRVFLEREPLFTEEEDVFVMEQRSPICEAIKNSKLIEIVVAMNEDQGQFKKFVVEPYAYGFDQNNQLLLQGVIREQDVIKQDASKSMKTNSRDGLQMRMDQKESQMMSMSANVENSWQDFSVSKVVSAKVLDKSFVPSSNGWQGKGKIVRMICANKIVTSPVSQ